MRWWEKKGRERDEDKEKRQRETDRETDRLRESDDVDEINIKLINDPYLDLT